MNISGGHSYDENIMYVNDYSTYQGTLFINRDKLIFGVN